MNIKKRGVLGIISWKRNECFCPRGQKGNPLRWKRKHKYATQVGKRKDDFT